MKAFLQNSLIRNTSKEYTRANVFLGFITVVSVLSISLETVALFNEYENIFRTIEYVMVIIFLLEYIARIYVNEDRKKYIFSFFGIVDLVSIVPSFFGLANLTFLKSARIIRVLHFLRATRLLKLTRLNKYSNSNSGKAKEVQNLSVRIYGIVLVGTVLIFGTLLYAIEGDNPLFQDIPSGVLWAAQAILGGDTDASSFSIYAKLLVIVIQFAGLLLFGLLIHLVGRLLERHLLGSQSTLN